MIVLGIESSCDDTAVGLVKNGKDVLANIKASQDEFHKDFGGVVPEVASRKHLELFLPTLDKALDTAKISFQEIDAIAVTNQPGLLGSLLMGVEFAKSLAYLYNKPLIPINHLQAHFYALQMSTDISYPYIGLLVSGGHTLLTICKSATDIDIIGSTLDDAVGECLDKIAKHYEIGYPGGPLIEKLALKGDADLIPYPISFLHDKEKRYHFSFSGLKTSVIYNTPKYFQENKNKTKANYAMEDIVASLQKTVMRTLYHKALYSVKDFKIKNVGVCGGVSINKYLRDIFNNSSDFKSFFPDFSLCTDNGAMVAGMAYEVSKTTDFDDVVKKTKTQFDRELLSLDVLPRNFKNKASLC